MGDTFAGSVKLVIFPERSCSWCTSLGWPNPLVNIARWVSPDQATRFHCAWALCADQVTSEYLPPAGSTRYSVAEPLVGLTPSPPVLLENIASAQLGPILLHGTAARVPVWPAPSTRSCVAGACAAMAGP